MTEPVTRIEFEEPIVRESVAEMVVRRILDMVRAGVLKAAGLLVRAGRFAARGLIRIVASALRPRVAVARAAWDFGRAAGLVAGLAGRRYQEYAERHESS